MSPFEPAPAEPLAATEVGALLRLARLTLGSDPMNPYFPPTDPVLRGETILGGFSGTSMEGLEVDASADGQFGDEALTEAILQELHADAATSGLDVDVVVKHRVAHLRGSVTDVEDAENAEEVASRLPQLVEVIDELELSCG